MKRTDTIEDVRNESVWSATTKMPICRRLASDVEVDVCIVGRGNRAG